MELMPKNEAEVALEGRAKPTALEGYRHPNAR